MKCDFTLEHYKEIIANALSADYKFSGFHERATNMQVYLRHDVDVSIDMALRMAQIDADIGVKSTFFVLPNSPTYNILDNDTIDKIMRIEALGHWVGLHIDLPRTYTDVQQATYLMYDYYKQFLPIIPVVSYHRPSKLNSNVFGMQLNGLINTYEDRFVRDCKYIRDSSRQWKDECPCQALALGTYSRIQLLIHPVWWVTSDIVAAWKTLVSDREQIMLQYLADNVTPFQDML